MEIVKLYSSNTIVSNLVLDDDVINAQFIICDFDPNKNGVQLNGNTIDAWVQTLCNKPVVGKVAKNQYGVDDFTSHNAYIVSKIDEDGNVVKDVKFDTQSFGSFKSVSIKEIDGKKYIVAEAELWRRYENACNVVLERIKAGNLYTSWEIAVLKSHTETVNGKTVKVIDEGKFLAHCCLSAQVEPAYDSSRLLEVAEKQESDTELADALSKDMLVLSDIDSIKKEEDERLKKNKMPDNHDVAIELSEDKKDIVDTASEQPTEEVTENDVAGTVDESEVKESSNEDKTNKDGVETSALTEWDLRSKINDACRAKLDGWCWVAYHFPNEKVVWVDYEGRESELDYKLFTYDVSADEVVVSEPIDVKLTVSISEVNAKIESLNSEIEKMSSALAGSATVIQDLNVQISELKPYKEKFEKDEQDRIASELEVKKQKLISTLVKSGLVSKEEIETSEEIKNLVETLNEKELNQIIAQRLIASLEEEAEQTTVETSAVVTEVAKCNLTDDEPEVSYKTVMNKFLNK